jgi:dipeptidase E
MRLFLSSYRAGKYDDKLREFIGSIDKIAVITNAKDYKTPQDRREKIEDNFNYYRSIGLEPTEIDLRPYFHKPGAEKLLSKHNFVWLAGGNVFLLRRALSYTGLDRFFYDMVRKNEVILGGESAGAIIMGPTLKYSEMDTDEDSPGYIPDAYQKDVIWDGLDLITYVPVPHYKTPDYGAEIDAYIANLDKAGIPHKDMTDEQAIMISGGKEEFLK